MAHLPGAASSPVEVIFGRGFLENLLERRSLGLPRGHGTCYHTTGEPLRTRSCNPLLNPEALCSWFFKHFLACDYRKSQPGLGLAILICGWPWSEAQLGTSPAFCREQDRANREDLRRVRY